MAGKLIQRRSALALTGFLLLCSFGCQGRARPEALPESGVSTPAASQPGLALENQPDPGAQVDSPERLPVSVEARQTAADLLAAEHPEADYPRLAMELRGLAPAALTPQAETAALQLDDQTEFYINADLNGDYQPIPARLRYLSEHAAWWVSLNANAGVAELEAAARNFEEEVYPLNQLLFGVEPTPGIDGEPRVHILLVEQPEWGGFYGYFSNINQYSKAIYPFSNQREMLVLNLGGAPLDSLSFAGELAHEHQHLIQWGKDPNEDLWLNEALSELATFMSGVQALNSAPGKTNAEIFAEYPHVQLTARPETSLDKDDLSTYAHYAAERLFTIYLFEQFGKEFIKNLVENPNPGVLSIQQELDKVSGSPRFDDVFGSWRLANYLNDRELLQGQFGYRGIEPVQPVVEAVQVAGSNTVAGQLAPYGARYYLVESDQPVEVTFSGSTTVPLTPADPASGQFAWYSNRGDGSDFTLTRAFDLSGVASANLQYKTWYELEEFFDYAYVEVSVDSGKSWTILKTANGTEANPNNQAYGWGYTGESGGWLSESLDLSAYAGKEINLRFQLVTDYTTNRDGFMVDDIAIPELGYQEGAEDGSGGWQARGFVRSSNRVPAGWILWLVKLGSQPEISWITVSEQGKAQFSLAGLGEQFPQALLVVSPTAPVTTLEVDYEFVFQHP